MAARQNRRARSTLRRVATAKLRCAAVISHSAPRSHGEDALCGGSFPGYGKRQDAARRWWLRHHRRRTFPHAAGGRFGPCCHSGSRRAYAWDSVAERTCVGFGFPWWAGRGRETVAWGGRGRVYTARVGELVVLVEAAMAHVRVRVLHLLRPQLVAMPAVATVGDRRRRKQDDRPSC